MIWSQSFGNISACKFKNVDNTQRNANVPFATCLNPPINKSTKEKIPDEINWLTETNRSYYICDSKWISPFTDGEANKKAHIHVEKREEKKILR